MPYTKTDPGVDIATTDCVNVSVTVANMHARMYTCPYCACVDPYCMQGCTHAHAVHV